MKFGFVVLVSLALLCSLLEGTASTSLFLQKYRRMKSVNETVLDDNEVFYFNQKRDHFDATDNHYFQQRYFFDSTYHVQGGPVFFMLGQEGPSNPRDVSVGLQIYLAEKFGALVVELEHRYYGKGTSMPVEDLSTPNMKWLSSSQALEDFAEFRMAFGDLHPELNIKREDKWVVFGCSYAGAMSSWLRAKYPHLFLSAVGGSGPVEAKVDFQEYDETVTYSLKLDSDNCHQQSKSAMDKAGAMAQDPTQLSYLETLFNTCTPISNPLDFVDTIYNPIAFSVQYNEVALFYPRNHLCKVMTNTDNTPLENLAKANHDIRLGSSPGCLNIELYTGDDGLLNTSTSVEMRKWMWQTCSEFGYYQTAADAPRNTMSPTLNVSYFIDMCTKTFDGIFDAASIQRNIDSTNHRYGARNPDPSNVLFPNGYEDPWSTLGIKRMLTPSDLPVLYRGAGHCAPYSAPANNESPSVKESREIIIVWLNYLLSQ